MERDPIFDIIKDEEKRQINNLEMIASENFTSLNVIKAVGSCLMNKYAEGYPGRRYYGGCENVDKIEKICQERALDLFKLNKEKWGVNVQALSGSVANMTVYGALLNIDDGITGLDLKSGGHLTHGFKVSFSSRNYRSFPYGLDSEGYINYDQIEEIVKNNGVKLIIIGYSAYTRDIDYRKIKKIGDKYKILIHCDMAHYAGLVACEKLDNPFDYCDVVTTTTHKTLRGPRGALIFYKKKFEKKINSSVFPCHQGGPFIHSIAGIAVALKEANSQEYRNYISQVIKNIKIFSEKMKEYGYKLVTDGTDNHLCLIDLKPLNLSGHYVQELLEKVGITVNKNTVVGDLNALKPNGIRIGSPALTSRGMKEIEFILIAKLIDEIIKHPHRIESVKSQILELALKFPNPSIGSKFNEQIFI